MRFRKYLMEKYYTTPVGSRKNSTEKSLLIYIEWESKLRKKLESVNRVKNKDITEIEIHSK